MSVKAMELIHEIRNCLAGMPDCPARQRARQLLEELWYELLVETPEHE